jgi:RNA-binding protein YhbY
VRAASLERDERDAALQSILARTGAQRVQQVGKVFVIYRKNEC